MQEPITSYCTGCKMCELVCPTKSISFVEDSEGFLFPHIDQSSCIDCGLCVKKCPQNNSAKGENLRMTYALKSKNKQILKKSASGGVFATLAYIIIKEGGYICGAVYDEKLNVKHIVSNQPSDILKMQSSKYVQSDIGDSYRRIKSLLDQNKYILFSGTGCQAAGLSSYLNKKYKNLIIIDIICHGVPSPKLFCRYLEYIHVVNKRKVSEINFRTKKKGDWGLRLEMLLDSQKKKKQKFKLAFLDPYYYHFLSGSIYRESCYKCKYFESKRFSDITIGDYWGLIDYHPKFYNLDGVSVLVCNNLKGTKFFEKVSDYFDYIPSKFDYACNKNKNLIKPTERPKNRDYIYKNINNEDVKKYFKENFHIPFKIIIIFGVKALFNPKIKLFIKKIIIKIKNK